jgi:hypothetical protein
MARMDWKTIAAAPAKPLLACFDLTDAERRFLLGVLLLFCLGLGARAIHRHNAQPAPYAPPPENPLP